jgi:predicted aspartyl protease
VADFLWVVVLSELIGHADDRERPLVRVFLPEQDRSFLSLVDTGFNGWLLMEAIDAVALGFALTEIAVPVEFAGRGQSRLVIAHGHILWFGQRQAIEVLVSMARGGGITSPDQPVVLLGTRLLSPRLLQIDFETRMVSIKSRD